MYCVSWDELVAFVVVELNWCVLCLCWLMCVVRVIVCVVGCWFGMVFVTMCVLLIMGVYGYVCVRGGLVVCVIACVSVWLRFAV